MNRTHFIADPHFFHRSMLDFCPLTRPYANVHEMNGVMASAWRSAVRPDDDVYVVGDFACRADPGASHALFQSLPGRKHLVVGNHDDKNTIALPWVSIRDIAYLSVESTKIVLCHYPLLSWPGSRKGALMLYGHHHGRIPGNQQSADIGVEVMGPAPVTLKQIKVYLSKLPPRDDPELEGLPNAPMVP